MIEISSGVFVDKEKQMPSVIYDVDINTTVVEGLTFDISDMDAFFDKADNDYTYRAHLPKWMFISPEDLARRIWNNVGYKTREINVPGYVAYLGWAYQVIPGLGDWAIKKFFDFQQDKKNL